MSALDCYSTIIGFTREEDDCVDGYDASFSVSDSGLFLDELQGMSLRVLESTGGMPDVWEKLVRARDNAVTTFQSDMFRELMKYKKPRRTRFYGDIGGRSFTQLVPQADAYWMRVYSDIRGGELHLSGASVIINGNETFDIDVYNDYELIDTFEVTSVANRPSRTDFPVRVYPLEGNLYFVMQPTARPYRNKLTCNCGGYRWCFSPENPCYKASRDKWTEWAMIGTGEGDLADMTARTVSRNGIGLILHGSFTCNVMGVLCSDLSDFEGNDVDKAIAHAVLYKTAEFATNYILDTDEVSRYTLIGQEALVDNREYYNERYAIMINYIAENIEDDRNECLSCKHPMGISRTMHRI